MQPPPEPQLEPEPPAESPAKKPRRKRRTKAEMEAIRAAKAAKAAEEAEKPIDPQIWIILGAGLLFLGGCIYFDPAGFMSAVDNSRSNTVIELVLGLVLPILGRNPTAIVLTVVGLLSLGWGLWGWAKRRFGAAQPQPGEKTES